MNSQQSAPMLLLLRSASVGTLGLWLVVATVAGCGKQEPPSPADELRSIMPTEAQKASREKKREKRKELKIVHAEMRSKPLLVLKGVLADDGRELSEAEWDHVEFVENIYRKPWQQIGKEFSILLTDEQKQIRAALQEEFAAQTTVTKPWLQTRAALQYSPQQKQKEFALQQARSLLKAEAVEVLLDVLRPEMIISTRTADIDRLLDGPELTPQQNVAVVELSEAAKCVKRELELAKKIPGIGWIQRVRKNTGLAQVAQLNQLIGSEQQAGLPHLLAAVAQLPVPRLSLIEEFTETLEFAADANQKYAFKLIDEEYSSQLDQVMKKWAGVLTPDQRRAGRASRSQAAPEADEQSVLSAVVDAEAWTVEQTNQAAQLDETWAALSNEVREAFGQVLTTEQFADSSEQFDLFFSPGALHTRARLLPITVQKNPAGAMQPPAGFLFRDVLANRGQNLTAEQFSAAKDLHRQFQSQLDLLNKEEVQTLTPEQQARINDVKEKNKAAGLKGQEATVALNEALGLTDTQINHRRRIWKARNLTQLAAATAAVKNFGADNISEAWTAELRKRARTSVVFQQVLVSGSTLTPDDFDLQAAAVAADYQLKFEELLAEESSLLSDEQRQTYREMSAAGDTSPESRRQSIQQKLGLTDEKMAQLDSLNSRRSELKKSAAIAMAERLGPDRIRNPWKTQQNPAADGLTAAQLESAVSCFVYQDIVVEGDQGLNADNRAAALTLAAAFKGSMQSINAAVDDLFTADQLPIKIQTLKDVRKLGIKGPEVAASLRTNVKHDQPTESRRICYNTLRQDVRQEAVRMMLEHVSAENIATHLQVSPAIARLTADIPLSPRLHRKLLDIGERTATAQRINWSNFYGEDHGNRVRQLLDLAAQTEIQNHLSEEQTQKLPAIDFDTIFENESPDNK